MTSRFVKTLVSLGLAATLFSVAGCGNDDDGGGDGVGFELRASPEFVQGLYADSPVSVLVEVVNQEATDAPVEIEASTEGNATVEVVDERLSEGGVGEVIVTASPVTDDVEVVLTITGTRGGNESTVTRTIVVMPGEDDREEVARDILAKFLEWFAAEHPDLGLDPETELEGSLVAPRLLVVSHYMFENEEYELGLSWHIMVAPDDWSEIYVRPKADFAPTEAYRMSSWSTALDGGDVDFNEVASPEEIVR